MFPLEVVKVFMDTNAEVDAIAPDIMRVYGLSYLLLPFNVRALYFFQSFSRSAVALVLSVSRGVVLSGILIWLLPAVFGAGALWWAMPATEAMIAAASRTMMRCHQALR